MARFVPPFGFWLLLFFLTPIIEMYLLLEVGGYLGAPITIGLVMLTAVIGVSLLKRQGLATLMRGQQRLAEGHLPAGEIAEGLLLAVAGPLLLTPGFVTDAAGFILLVPGIRQLLARRLGQRLTVAGTGGAAGRRFGGSGPFRPGGPMDPGRGPGDTGGGPAGSNGPGEVIEGEYSSKDEVNSDRLGPRP